MDQRVIQYAAGPPQRVTHSRPAVIAFACAAASLCGLGIVFFFLLFPMPGPAGSFIRERAAPVFAIAMLALWFGGIGFAAAALRERTRLRAFAAWALILSGAMAVVFGLMILLMY